MSIDVTISKTITLDIKGQKIVLTENEAKELASKIQTMLNITSPPSIAEPLGWPTPPGWPKPPALFGDGINTIKAYEQPCLFDGLEPGVYGISCPCPRCNPVVMS